MLVVVLEISASHSSLVECCCPGLCPAGFISVPTLAHAIFNFLHLTHLATLWKICVVTYMEHIEYHPHGDSPCSFTSESIEKLY